MIVNKVSESADDIYCANVDFQAKLTIIKEYGPYG